MDHSSCLHSNCCVVVVVVVVIAVVVVVGVYGGWSCPDHMHHATAEPRTRDPAVGMSTGTGLGGNVRYIVWHHHALFLYLKQISYV